MPTLNYAEQWEQELLALRIQETLSSPFITTNVKWVGARTFHFTHMRTSGYKPHSRSGGWNSGSFEQGDVPFTVTHDRDIEFLVDKADVDETNATASIRNITEVFEKTQIPRMDRNRKRKQCNRLRQKIRRKTSIRRLLFQIRRFSFRVRQKARRLF